MRSIKLPSWHKTGFASNVNDLLSRVGIITRPLGFATRGYLRSALRSLRSLRTSHSFGRPDLSSELPLVPRVKGHSSRVEKEWDLLHRSFFLSLTNFIFQSRISVNYESFLASSVGKSIFKKSSNSGYPETGLSMSSDGKLGQLGLMRVKEAFAVIQFLSVKFLNKP